MSYAKEVIRKEQECATQGVPYVSSEESDYSEDSDNSFDESSGSDSMMEEIPEDDSNEYTASDESKADETPNNQIPKSSLNHLSQMYSLNDSINQTPKPNASQQIQNFIS